MKTPPTLTFTFINPNPPGVFEEVLKKILLEKLLAKFAYPEEFSSGG